MLCLSSYPLSARTNTCWHCRSVVYFVSVSLLLCAESAFQNCSRSFLFFFFPVILFWVQILNVKEGYCVCESSCIHFLLVCNAYFLSRWFRAYSFSLRKEKEKKNSYGNWHCTVHVSTNKLPLSPLLPNVLLVLCYTKWSTNFNGRLLWNFHNSSLSTSSKLICSQNGDLPSFIFIWVLICVWTRDLLIWNAPVLLKILIWCRAGVAQYTSAVEFPKFAKYPCVCCSSYNHIWSLSLGNHVVLRLSQRVKKTRLTAMCQKYNVLAVYTNQIPVMSNQSV